MRFWYTLIFLVSSSAMFAQLPFTEEQFFARLTPGSSLPENLLSTKSAVFYDFSIPSKDLEKIQKGFQRTGIDAVVYYELDLVSIGRDPVVVLADVLNKREISNLVFLQKRGNDYVITITPYNKKANFVEQGQNAFKVQHNALDYLLQQLYRTAATSLRNENFLINDFPETRAAVNGVVGRRSEFFAIDLKVDPLAVPKFGDSIMDQRLEQIMALYPYKYTLTEPNLSEAELRKQGYLYVLRFVHARNRVTRNALGYDVPKSQSAIVSVTFGENGSRLSNFPANEIVYKFYFKHIDSDNVFLGTKWDADPSWEQALLNQLRGYRQEFNIN